ncbi:TetR/AcrR family transcriptional regulator [Nocardiopsis sp. CT-R113]|uniref:TetR/AcrR family transcriptional regulator n=1 Tax=Nocardiopsis codii TaxID=3065942 RepID=A0ABU7KEY7_9ACTN|nr:TetR/AcrR family transcriptional regulator [Nocardiopsis sp. CT-R113]MEE2040772.1 TetR/AcrR family transcriptional regulator [Nocardiopsis sp. CT-R113]
MTTPLVPFGKSRGERADAARNRERLLEAARAVIAEQGTSQVTMDGLAERAGLGKGTVFRRFGSRAGIFRALLDDDERRFQERVLSGPPPLGPGADPVRRLVAYGCERVPFLLEHHAIARAAVDRSHPTPAGAASMTQPHLRMLLGLAGLPPAHLDGLTVQLTAALEGPLMLYLSAEEVPELPEPGAPHPLVDGWRFLVERLVGG